MRGYSVWQKNDPCGKRYPRLTGDISANALVIGGGIAGYLTAYMLARSGRKVALVEGYRLFSGTTGGTTAKITYHQGGIYPRLVKSSGISAARRYYEAQRAGMDELISLATEHNIDCSLSPIDGYIFSADGDEAQRIYAAMSDIGVRTELVRADTPVGSALAVRAEDQFIFDPLRFLRALPVGFDIYENTRVSRVDVEKKTAYTEEGSVHADMIVVATRFPIIDSHGSYIFRMRPSESYTIAVEGATLDATYLDAREDGLSLRPYDGGVTVGGLDRRTGTGDGHAFFALRAAAARMFGERRIAAEWSAQDCVTFDGVPYVGYYSPELRDVYVITGFGKWGMANSAVAARLVTDLADGRDNPFERLYSPARRRKGTFGAFLRNAARSAAYLIGGRLHFPLRGARSIEPGGGKVVRLHGKKRAVYKEPDGRLYAIDAMCPHLRAELRWNADSKTWDCPCHGSRFDRYGNLLSAPSVHSCKTHARLAAEKERNKKKKTDTSEADI